MKKPQKLREGVLEKRVLPISSPGVMVRQGRSWRETGSLRHLMMIEGQENHHGIFCCITPKHYASAASFA
ncbi:hypothetical protein I7I48_08906 [Histoplasma ohiense]|nr:hypothetical protein I7I48_08906 [Histoplasma ohiense (nom. inval.)]